jgi:hypothetical protein
VRNGQLLRLVGTCPYGSDYIHLSLAFAPVDGPPLSGGYGYVVAHTSTFSGQVGDGSVSALVAAGSNGCRDV